MYPKHLMVLKECWIPNLQFFSSIFYFFCIYYKNAYLADYLGPYSVTKKNPTGNSWKNNKEIFVKKIRERKVKKSDFLKTMNLKLALSPLLLTLFLINLISLVKDYY